MSGVFMSASQRHHKDADFLLENERLDNADQLFGLSAECSLKAVMVALGMATDDTRGAGTPRDRAHKVHMPLVWSAFQSFAVGALGARYLYTLDHDNPFVDWDVEQRYNTTGSVPFAAVDKHRVASVQCRGTVEAAFLDGVLR